METVVLCASGPGPASPGRFRADALIPWYRNMATCWLSVHPPIRRRLILATHHWVVHAVLQPLSRGEPPHLEDLEPGGTLQRALVSALPGGESAVPGSWIRLVVQDLRRALTWPPEQRTEMWGRWLFLIPYGIPVQAMRPAGATRPGGPRAGDRSGPRRGEGSDGVSPA